MDSKKLYNLVQHVNTWIWGTSSTFIWNGGLVLCHLADNNDDKKNNSVCLHTLLVHDSCRNQGLGTEAVRFCMDVALDRGYDSLYLWADKPIDPERTIYHRLGFEVYKETDEAYWFEYKFNKD